MIGSLYSWLWYHSEFWIANKFKRRPFTYIMRDWIYPHPGDFGIIVVAWYIIIICLAFFARYPALILAILSSLLVAHLVWGSRWIKGQQEKPAYNPDKDPAQGADPPAPGPETK